MWRLRWGGLGLVFPPFLGESCLGGMRGVLVLREGKGAGEGGIGSGARPTTVVCNHLGPGSPTLGLTPTEMVEDCSCQTGCAVCLVGGV